MRWFVFLLLLGGGIAVFATSRGGDEAPDLDPASMPGRRHPESFLTADRRRQLFDLERADLLLGRALAPLLDAIRRGDDVAVRASLATGFRASLPTAHANAPTETTAAYARTPFDGTNEVDADGFLAWLAAVRGGFDEVASISFGRKRNSATILEGPSVEARSSGAFRIAGTREGGGPLEIAGRFELAHDSLGEYAGEGDLTGWVRGLVLMDVVRVEAPTKLFDEITAHCGIDAETLHDNWRDRRKASYVQVGGAYLGDVNADEILDLVVTDRRRTWLYLGLGTGSFRDTGWDPPTSATALTHVAIFDATGDGATEILHGGRLYRWDPAVGKPVRLQAATVLPNADPSLCDYDRDGRTDVYLRYAGRYAGARSGPRAFFDDARVTGRQNVLYRNLGDGQFEDVTQRTGASGGFGRTFASAWFYANEDPWPDLFCANEFGRNAFLVADGHGGFAEHPDVDPQFGGFSMGLSTGDLDGDGRTDLYVSNMYSKAGHRVYHHLDLNLYPPSVRRMFMASVTGNRYYRARGDLHFDERATAAGVNAVGWGWSGAIADFDLDGWLDLYAPCGHTSVDRKAPDG